MPHMFAIIGMILRVLLSALVVPSVGNDPTGAIATRTDWIMHEGLETGGPANCEDCITFTPATPRHGDDSIYQYATIPPRDHSGWHTNVDPDIINMDRTSKLCVITNNCLMSADFAYFQTLVTVPDVSLLTTFTISFRGMDDGSRVTVFNSRYPNGEVVPGSYVYLGGTGTANLKDLMVTGVNRVVITQVDDCCSNNDLLEAKVVINSNPIPPSTDPPPTPSPSTPSPCDRDTRGACSQFGGLCFTETRGDTFCNRETGTCWCSLPDECAFNRSIALTKGGKWGVCRKHINETRGEDNALHWAWLVATDIAKAYGKALTGSNDYPGENGNLSTIDNASLLSAAEQTNLHQLLHAIVPFLHAFLFLNYLL